MGAGEGALLVAEQDALDQVLGQGAAVDRHERLAGALGAAVDRAGDQLLAHPALAQDQDRDRSLGGAFPQALDQAHRARGADQIGEGGVARGVLLQPVDLGRQLPHLQAVAHADDDPLGARRLDEEVLGPGLHGLDHSVDAAARGQHHGRSRDPAGAGGLQEVQPTHVRHDQVEDHHVGRQARGQTVQRRLAPVRLHDREALALEHRLHQPALGGVVVDDQDGLAHKGKYAPSPSAGRAVRGSLWGARDEGSV